MYSISEQVSIIMYLMLCVIHFKAYDYMLVDYRLIFFCFSYTCILSVSEDIPWRELFFSCQQTTRLPEIVSRFSCLPSVLNEFPTYLMYRTRVYVFDF